MSHPVAPALVDRLYRDARADRWRLATDRFTAALASSAARAFEGRRPSASEVERYVAGLHAADLALACACADGDEGAWEHFMAECRPALYRAAEAIAPGGSARDLADELYAELYGIDSRGGERRSLFRYYHGRSSLATWLRAVLAQRYVDRLRSTRRLEPLPEDESVEAPAPPVEPERARWLTLVGAALARSRAALDPRDRIRLDAYYAREMTLAQIGRTLGEHEATVSRHLARIRRRLREDIERDLRAAGLDDGEVTACLSSVAGDPGPIDLAAQPDLQASGAPIVQRREDDTP